ncbi:C40 family peptidase [Niabella beijingensis]|uniref:C40 family peptidase n=1 Tax=Niabella beijingensis TaxID=2872700 RepID=UPI001CBE4257|nr:C40 family peptidase [Niabella beijingensis]MBZ4188474.1 C40 family peptidase [Niabella beijingensis]
MLPRKIVGALLITLIVSGCTLFKKPVAHDYSTSLYINNSTNKDSNNTRATTAANKNGAAGASTLSRSDSLLKTKYAYYLQVPADSITNLKLYRFIDEWLNTPYQWGGTTKRGIDCSALMQRLLAEVYEIYIPRTSYQQYFTENVERFARWESLAEGDLIFFKTIPGNPITHVGLYLGNGRFVNSASRGVTIESLRKPYWATRYVASGRLIVNKSRKVAKN